MQARKLLVPVAALAAAVAIGAGCGESQKTAEQALCADIASFRANVTTLTETSPVTNLDAFRQARENVRESWRELQDSAANVGTSHFDDVSDAWDDIRETLNDVDDLAGLRAVRTQLSEDLTRFDQSTTRLVDAIKCPDTGN